MYTRQKVSSGLLVGQGSFNMRTRRAHGLRVSSQRKEPLFKEAKDLFKEPRQFKTGSRLCQFKNVVTHLKCGYIDRYLVRTWSVMIVSFPGRLLVMLWGKATARKGNS